MVKCTLEALVYSYSYKIVAFIDLPIEEMAIDTNLSVVLYIYKPLVCH